MDSKILTFEDAPNNKIIYNPSVPFSYKDKTYMFVRVESLEVLLDSKAYLAVQINQDKWYIDYSFKPLNLEDPAIAKIGENLILSGVKVKQVNSHVEFVTEFYNIDSDFKSHYLFSGPQQMKDIRLVDLENRLGIFTRPQGKIGGKGKIGYFEVSSLDDLMSLKETDWYGAYLLEGLFDENSWGGVIKLV